MFLGHPLLGPYIFVFVTLDMYFINWLSNNNNNFFKPLQITYIYTLTHTVIHLWVKTKFLPNYT
jgi:hypothetical protein